MAALTILLFACDPATADRSASEADAAAAEEPGAAFLVDPATHNIVDVSTTAMDIDMPDSIASGWTTFRYRNASDVTHFLVLERMPEGRTIEDTRAEVVPVFQEAMALVLAGQREAGFAEFEKLPAWFFDVAFVGGPGLTGPGRTSLATVYVEPGTYVIECYVKMPDGTFHSAAGMTVALTVTDTPSSAVEPDATINVEIGADGIEILDPAGAGTQTIAVRFIDQSAHEHFLGHDVHLARIDDDTDLAALSAWMDWSAPQGLTTPAPVAFLGGTQELPAGKTAYITAVLEPGRYALIAEVPDPLGKGMLQTFEVPAQGALR